MNVVLTGFEPFGGNVLNPSQEVTRWFANNGLHQRSDVKLHTLVLPVTHAAAPKQIINLIDEYEPDVLIMTGEAKGRAVVSIERIAINLIDYTMPDNDNVQIADEPVVHGGPAAYFATLAVKESANELRQMGVAVEISQDAGTCLCNEIMYTALHHLATTNRHHTRAGFVHLPWLPEQVVYAQSQSGGARPVPSMSLQHLIQGVGAILTTAIDALPSSAMLAENHADT